MLDFSGFGNVLIKKKSSLKDGFLKVIGILVMSYGGVDASTAQRKTSQRLSKTAMNSRI